MSRLWHAKLVVTSAAPYSSVRRKARRGLAVYFAVVVAFSVVIETVIIRRPDIDGPFIALLMWVPALSSVVARLALKEGFADVSFRFGGQRTVKAILLALVFPTVVGIIAYGCAWASGLAVFDPASGEMPPVLGFVTKLVLATTLWTFLSSLLTAGEEIGWRGYMLTRLIDAGVPRPVFVSGVIWGIWHVPVVLGGVYAAGPSPVLSAGIILISIVSFSYVISRLRLETGSVWPAVVLHAAWNSVIQGPFDGATAGEAATLWVGESGILTAITLLVVAALASTGNWDFRRAPTPPASRL